jgi:hypothetical protein
MAVWKCREEDKALEIGIRAKGREEKERKGEQMCCQEER